MPDGRAHGGGPWGAPTPLLVVLAAALWLLPAPARAAGSEPTLTAPPGFMGASGRLETHRDFATMERAGIGTYRTLFHFRAAKRGSQGFYRWRRFDWLVSRAAARGIELLPVLYGSPDWVRSDETIPPIHTAEGRREWHRLLVRLVRRYGPDGEFWLRNPLVPYRPVRAWQIWNEPNDPRFWSPAPSPEGFARLMTLSASAIRSVDPGAKIVSGGIVARPTRAGSIRGPRFLAAFLRQPGALAATGQVGYHPYARGARGVRWHLRRARRAIRRAGGGPKPIWVTEFGWSSQRSLRRILFKSSLGQARALKLTSTMMVRQRHRLGIARALWYYWRDHWDPFCMWCRTAGLLGNRYTQKPSFEAFDRLTP